MGALSRNKGHQFERDVAIALRDVFPKARRHLEYQDSQANGVDLAETGKFHFQCKKLKRYASIATINEVQCDRRLGDVPVLVTAGDREPAMVAMHFGDFLDLLRQASRNEAL